MGTSLNHIVGPPYHPKTPYIDGFDAACWLGLYWDNNETHEQQQHQCPQKYKQGTDAYASWHEGYADGMEERDDHMGELLRPHPPEHQYVDRSGTQEAIVECVGDVDCDISDMESSDE